tara:strand:+ start:101 stop:445 length:345 start_codon:yes stop_codon:yes gene_type:complete
MPWKYNGQTVSTSKGFRKTDGYMTPRNWNVVWDDTEKKNQGLTWEDDPTPTKSDADKLADLRRERDWRLADTDFYALSDQTLSTDMKNYRQALRDITKSYQSMDAVGFAWPTKP